MAGWHTNADLYHQWEEAEARAEKWERTCKEERRQHKDEIAAMRAEFRHEMVEMRGELNEKITHLEMQVQELKEANKALKEDNERLKSIINNDSHNSSLPPSGDQKPGRKKAANEYNSRERSGKKRGGQPGHKGASLTKQEAEALIASGKVEHEVISIGKAKNGSDNYISKYEYDLVMKTVVREYRYYPDEKGKYDLPVSQRTDVWYGNGLKTMAVALYNIGIMSNERIRELLNAMSDEVLKISDGAVYGFIRGFAQRIQPEMEKIDEDLLNQSVLMTDGTTVSVGGVQSHIRNVSSARSVRYYGMDRKNLASLRGIPLLKHFQGTFVHDHETALYHFGTDHAECNVHLLRYLTKNTEDTGNEWSGEMKALLSEMNRSRKELILKGEEAFATEQIEQYEIRYDEIVNTGRQQNACTRPKWARSDELSLLNRLEKYKANHLLFLRRFDVPFDNNMSERDLRKCKNRQKMSGGFGLSCGRDMACDILSFVETCKRRSLNVLQSIRDAFTASILS